MSDTTPEQPMEQDSQIGKMMAAKRDVLEMEKALGYKRQKDEVHDLMVVLTNKEKELITLVKSISLTLPINDDWKRAGLVDIQRGFMELRRAITRPTEDGE